MSGTHVMAPIPRVSLGVNTTGQVRVDTLSDVDHHVSCAREHDFGPRMDRMPTWA